MAPAEVFKNHLNSTITGSGHKSQRTKGAKRARPCGQHRSAVARAASTQHLNLLVEALFSPRV